MTKTATNPEGRTKSRNRSKFRSEVAETLLDEMSDEGHYWHTDRPQCMYDDADLNTPAGQYLSGRIIDYNLPPPPGSFVISGPVGRHQDERRGRWFRNEIEAVSWAVEKYGARRVELLPSYLSHGVKWMIRIHPEQSEAES